MSLFKLREGENVEEDKKKKSIEVIKMKMSIKEVMECMTSNGIEW